MTKNITSFWTINYEEKEESRLLGKQRRADLTKQMAPEVFYAWFRLVWFVYITKFTRSWIQSIWKYWILDSCTENRDMVLNISVFDVKIWITVLSTGVPAYVRIFWYAAYDKKHTTCSKVFFNVHLLKKIFAFCGNWRFIVPL